MEGETMKPGRERCKAWMYSVINPLLAGLRIEASFLARGNWTFRRYNRDLEFIRPIHAFVAYQSRPNWDDFTTSNPAVRESADNREDRRNDLRKACNAAFEDLIAVKEFQSKASEDLIAFVKETGTDPGSIFNPNIEPYEGVAEIIVNNIAELPDHYGPHLFWSRYRGALIQFRRGPKFEFADQAGLKVQKSGDDLSAELTRLRSDLAAEYDIPWAPYYDESMALPGR